MLNKRAQNEKTLDDTNQRIKGAIEYSVNSLKAELIQNETYPSPDRKSSTSTQSSLTLQPVGFLPAWVSRS
jgi:hypothetical protein